MKLYLFVIGLVIYSNGLYAAKYKPVELHPDYSHDKYITELKDIVREFRTYLSNFDSDDDDNDGSVDLWGIPEFVTYEIKKFEGTLGKASPTVG